MKKAWEYPWSSCAGYAQGKADPLITEDPSYRQLSQSVARRQQLWREFLCGEDEKEAVIREADWAVGDEGFKGRMAQVLGRPQPRPRGRPAKVEGRTGTYMT